MRNCAVMVIFARQGRSKVALSMEAAPGIPDVMLRRPFADPAGSCPALRTAHHIDRISGPVVLAAGLMAADQLSHLDTT